MSYILHPRMAVIENVDKMINCGDPSYGDVMFGCSFPLPQPFLSYLRNGENVTFHYNRHEDEKLVSETIPVLDFIERLIRHIPEKHFKMIRYYGLYARHRASDKKLIHAILKEKHKFYLSLNRWRECILSSFGYDPIKCPCCGNTMNNHTEELRTNIFKILLKA